MRVRATKLVYTGQTGKPFLQAGEEADVKESMAKRLVGVGAVEKLEKTAEPTKKPKRRRASKKTEEAPVEEGAPEAEAIEVE